MRIGKLSGKRLKEKPADATLKSHEFLIRGGYARQVAGGIYSLMYPGLRVIKKIEAIIREEITAVGGQEVLMPVVMPRELWDESGRYESVGSELVRFQDRGGHGMLLGMTHEEAVVHLFRNDVDSYRDLPFSTFQIQTKFRDEPRSRGGLIRVREFTMKDAYSFHRTQEGLQKCYDAYAGAYTRIYARAGIPETVVVASDSGMMGGSIAHEYMLLSDAGEDTIVTCPKCGYLANLEVAEGQIAGSEEPPAPLEKVHTPHKQTIEEVAAFLGMETNQTAKAVFYDRDAEGKVVMALIRGDVEINEAKLAKIVKAPLEMADNTRIEAVGAVPGYASVLGIDTEKCRIVVDHTIANSNNLVCGANQVDWHQKNFNLARDFPGCVTVDIAQVREDDGCPQCGSRIQMKRGIEVGNIFQLGTKYTEKMGMRYLDESGKEQVPIMGCYGIGVGRLMGSVMEAKHDACGPIWPMTIAPWQVHICAINYKKKEIADVAEKLYTDLEANGVEVLIDDRDERAGVQFADADLFGIPIRVVVSPRNLKSGAVEVVKRGERGGEMVPIDQAADKVTGQVRNAIEEIVTRADELVPSTGRTT